jgi:phosphate/sulfate permease
MTHEVHKVVRESGGFRIVIADSATSITKDNKNDIVVDGSHCGANIAPDYVLPNGARGMIGNDAGIGLESAGVASLKILEEHGIPAAAVAAMSAEIGVGQSTYNEGVISTVNEVAKKMGVTAGMSAKEAADKMLEGIS